MHVWSFLCSWMLPANSRTVLLPPRTKPTLLKHQCLVWRIYLKGTSYSFSRRKNLNPRKQCSQLELLKAAQGQSFERRLNPSSPLPHKHSCLWSLLWLPTAQPLPCVQDWTRCSRCSFNTHSKAALRGTGLMRAAEGHGTATHPQVPAQR